jgi:L-lysine exporter family protein LysE/ArgO
MEYLVLGFFTGLSLILAIGAQNIFVIEQGLKKQHIFLVCLICSLSDLILIFLGIFLFHYFIQYFNPTVELIFNILLIIFLIHFIYSKIKSYSSKVNFKNKITDISKFDIFLKTLVFTYLNPHVYSDTVFFLGNFSKNFLIKEKIIFGIGASVASFLFFFLIGYLSKFFSKYAKDQNIWNIINILIILFMSILVIIFVNEALYSLNIFLI